MVPMSLLHLGLAVTVIGVLLSILTAYVARVFNNVMDFLQLIFAFINAPLFATFLLGMFAGYLSWAALVVAIVGAFLLGGIAAIVGLVIAHKKRADAIAFGPYLILGAYGGILAGVPVAAWYLSGWA
jgi:SSS family solute:Na+ symporter